MTIINYHIKRDGIELIHPDGFTLITDECQMETIKSWIRDAKRWVPDVPGKKFYICNWIEIKMKEVYGCCNS